MRGSAIQETRTAESSVEPYSKPGNNHSPHRSQRWSPVYFYRWGNAPIKSGISDEVQGDAGLKGRNSIVHLAAWVKQPTLNIFSFILGYVYNLELRWGDNELILEIDTDIQDNMWRWERTIHECAMKLKFILLKCIYRHIISLCTFLNVFIIYHTYIFTIATYYPYI